MSDKGYVLTEDDLLPLSIGAALLGTGGGGNPYIGMLRSRELVRKGAQVRVLPLDALPDDAVIVQVGGIGGAIFASYPAAVRFADRRRAKDQRDGARLVAAKQAAAPRHVDAAHVESRLARPQ